MKLVKIQEIEKGREQAEELIKEVINSYQNQFNMQIQDIYLEFGDAGQIKKFTFVDSYRG